MAIYMVDRRPPGVTPEQLGAAQLVAVETGRRFTDAGKPVRYLHSTFLPGDERWMRLVEAP